MLRPEDRKNLLAALRPPDGYSFDYAIGTAFSLDLLTLLSIPLAFTMFYRDGEGYGWLDDPILLLEALRDHAGRLAIFCQAGQIAVPQTQQLLFSFLEHSVHEVAPRSPRGVFHPKVWALRYRSEEPGDEGAVRYRLLTLSRNLTFDRSWDTMLVLDGQLTERAYAFAHNRALGDLFATLPDLAVRGVSKEVRQEAVNIAHELQRVRFDLPPGFSNVSFHAFGLRRGDRWPFDIRKDRVLVVSPFVAPSFLKRIAQNCDDITLISRLDTLSGLTSKELEPCKTLYVLDPATETAVEGEQETAADGSAESEFNTPLSGLHAKLYLVEQGWNAQLWTGSSNATNAAFHHNVEFMVSLEGRKSQVGIDQLLVQRKDEFCFRDLLKPFVPGEAVPVDDPVKKKLEERIATLQRQLGKLLLTARVAQKVEDGELYQLSLHIVDSKTNFEFPGNMQLYSWPITLDSSQLSPCRLSDDPMVRFFLSLEALTSFIAFEIRAVEDDVSVCKRFVLNIPLESLPPGRRESIVRRLLKNPDAVLRYLLVLLATEEDLSDIVSKLTKRDGAINAAHHAQMTLFEPLVRALARDPTRLDKIQRLVEDLVLESGDGALLPEGFLDIWQPIWQARQSLLEEQTTR